MALPSEGLSVPFFFYFKAFIIVDGGGENLEGGGASPTQHCLFIFTADVLSKVERTR